MVPGRSSGVPEWLDMIKQEFESLGHEVAATNVQKEEYEHKSMSCAGSHFAL
jgi:glucose repression regulatory protein TUP1